MKATGYPEDSFNQLVHSHFQPFQSLNKSNCPSSPALAPPSALNNPFQFPINVIQPTKTQFRTSSVTSSVSESSISSSRKKTTNRNKEPQDSDDPSNFVSVVNCENEDFGYSQMHKSPSVSSFKASSPVAKMSYSSSRMVNENDDYMCHFVSESLRNMSLSRITEILISVFRRHKEEFSRFHLECTMSQKKHSQPAPSFPFTTSDNFGDLNSFLNSKMNAVKGSSGNHNKGKTVSVKNTVYEKHMNYHRSLKMHHHSIQPKEESSSSPKSKGSPLKNFSTNRANLMSQQPKQTKSGGNSVIFGGQLSSRNGEDGLVEAWQPQNQPIQGESMRQRAQNLQINNGRQNPQANSTNQISKGVSSSISVDSFGFASPKAALISEKEGNFSKFQVPVDRKLIERAHLLKKTNGASLSFALGPNPINSEANSKQLKHRDYMRSRNNHIESPKLGPSNTVSDVQTRMRSEPKLEGLNSSSVMNSGQKNQSNRPSNKNSQGTSTPMKQFNKRTGSAVASGPSHRTLEHGQISKKTEKTTINPSPHVVKLFKNGGKSERKQPFSAIQAESQLFARGPSPEKGKHTKSNSGQLLIGTGGISQPNFKKPTGSIQTQSIQSSFLLGQTQELHQNPISSNSISNCGYFNSKETTKTSHY